MSSSDMVTIPQPGKVSLLQADLDTAGDYAAASRAASTRTAYARDWHRFESWCAAHGLPPIPAAPRHVAAFIAAEARVGLLPPTITRRLAAIAWAHRLSGHPSPQRSPGGGAILEVMAGIRRSRTEPVVKMAAADADILARMLAVVEGDGIRAVRARALVAVGMAGAFRRSELVAVRFEDVAREAEGIKVLIRRSKADQEGEGAVVAIPHGRSIRPVGLLDAWIEAARIDGGFLFRRLDASDRVLDAPMGAHAVSRQVKALAALAGLDQDDFGGHSLRAGFITAAARSGASVFKIQSISRHKSLDTLAGYVRDANAFRDHAGDGFL